MSTWDEAKLREVVSRKGNPKVTTDIVCKHFLQAVETGKYGWFWYVSPFSSLSSLPLEIAKGEVERNTGSAQMVETNVNTDMLSHLVSYSNRKRRRKKPTQRNKKSRSKNSSKSK